MVMDTGLCSVICRLVLAALAALSFSACSSLQGVSRDLANNAPPASPPVIVKTSNLQSWQSDSKLYSKWPYFSVDVRYGLANKLVLLKDGVEVSRFETGTPASDAKTVYTTTDTASDTRQKTVTSHLRIMAPAAGWVEAQPMVFTLQETSINPAYKSTAQEIASSSLTVVSVKKPCRLSLSAPASANQGSSFEVNWSAQDCKRYDFIVDGQTQEGRIFQEPANNRSSTFRANADKPVRNFKLMGRNATGDAALLERSVSVNVPAPAAQCPANPGGLPQLFNVKAVCSSQISGDYCYEVRQVTACNESKAKEAVQPYYANCAVSLGDCPVP